MELKDECFCDSVQDPMQYLELLKLKYLERTAKLRQQQMELESKIFQMETFLKTNDTATTTKCQCDEDEIPRVFPKYPDTPERDVPKVDSAAKPQVMSCSFFQKMMDNAKSILSIKYSYPTASAVNDETTISSVLVTASKNTAELDCNLTDKSSSTFCEESEESAAQELSSSSPKTTTGTSCICDRSVQQALASRKTQTSTGKIKTSAQTSTSVAVADSSISKDVATTSILATRSDNMMKLCKCDSSIVDDQRLTLENFYVQDERLINLAVQTSYQGRSKAVSPHQTYRCEDKSASCGYLKCRTNVTVQTTEFGKRSRDNQCSLIGSPALGYKPKSLEKICVSKIYPLQQDMSELAQNERDLQAQNEQLQIKKEAYEVLRTTMGNLKPEICCPCGVNQKELESEVMRMSQELRLENSALKSELLNMKVELKHCLEKVEGPMKQKLLTEKMRCEQLQQDLHIASKNLLLNQDVYLREMNALQLQLCCANSNIAELNQMNQRLKNEMDQLDSVCAKLEDDLIKQKISEAETIKRIARRKYGVELPTQESDEFNCDSSLAVIARKLSKTLKESGPCEDCSKLPAELAGAAKCIKDLTDLVLSRKPQKTISKTVPKLTRTEEHDICFCRASVEDDFVLPATEYQSEKEVKTLLSVPPSFSQEERNGREITFAQATDQPSVDKVTYPCSGIGEPCKTKIADYDASIAHPPTDIEVPSKLTKPESHAKSDIPCEVLNIPCREDIESKESQPPSHILCTAVCSQIVEPTRIEKEITADLKPEMKNEFCTTTLSSREHILICPPTAKKPEQDTSMKPEASLRKDIENITHEIIDRLPEKMQKSLTPSTTLHSIRKETSFQSDPDERENILDTPSNQLEEKEMREFELADDSLSFDKVKKYTRTVDEGEFPKAQPESEKVELRAEPELLQDITEFQVHKELEKESVQVTKPKSLEPEIERRLVTDPEIMVCKETVIPKHISKPLLKEDSMQAKPIATLLETQPTLSTQLFEEVRIGSLPFAVSNQIEVLEEPPSGLHMTTTITGSGTLEVTTEGPAGTIETTLTYTIDGNVEVVTEMVQFMEHTKSPISLPKESLISAHPEVHDKEARLKPIVPIKSSLISGPSAQDTPYSSTELTSELTSQITGDMDETVPIIRDSKEMVIPPRDLEPETIASLQLVTTEEVPSSVLSERHEIKDPIGDDEAEPPSEESGVRPSDETGAVIKDKGLEYVVPPFSEFAVETRVTDAVPQKHIALDAATVAPVAEETSKPTVKSHGVDCGCQSKDEKEQSCQCCECKEIGITTSGDKETITEIEEMCKIQEEDGDKDESESDFMTLSETNEIAEEQESGKKTGDTVEEISNLPSDKPEIQMEIDQILFTKHPELRSKTLEELQEALTTLGYAQPVIDKMISQKFSYTLPKESELPSETMQKDAFDHILPEEFRSKTVEELREAMSTLGYAQPVIDKMISQKFCDMLPKESELPSETMQKDALDHILPEEFRSKTVEELREAISTLGYAQPVIDKMISQKFSDMLPKESELPSETMQKDAFDHISQGEIMRLEKTAEQQLSKKHLPTSQVPVVFRSSKSAELSKEQAIAHTSRHSEQTVPKSLKHMEDKELPEISPQAQELISGLEYRSDDIKPGLYAKTKEVPSVEQEKVTLKEPDKIPHIAVESALPHIRMQMGEKHAQQFERQIRPDISFPIESMDRSKESTTLDEHHLKLVDRPTSTSKEVVYRDAPGVAAKKEILMMDVEETIAVTEHSSLLLKEPQEIRSKSESCKAICSSIRIASAAALSIDRSKSVSLQEKPSSREESASCKASCRTISVQSSKTKTKDIAMSPVVPQNTSNHEVNIEEALYKSKPKEVPSIVSQLSDKDLNPVSTGQTFKKNRSQRKKRNPSSKVLKKIECDCGDVCQCIICAPKVIEKRNAGLRRRSFSCECPPQVIVVPQVMQMTCSRSVGHSQGCTCEDCRCSPCTPCPNIDKKTTASDCRAECSEKSDRKSKRGKSKTTIDDVFISCKSPEMYQNCKHEKSVAHQEYCECVDCLTLPKIKQLAMTRECPIVFDEKQVYQVKVNCECVNATNARRYVEQQRSRIPISITSPHPPRVRQDPVQRPETDTIEPKPSASESTYKSACECQPCKCDSCVDPDVKKPVTPPVDKKRKTCFCIGVCACKVCPDTKHALVAGEGGTPAVSDITGPVKPIDDIMQAPSEAADEPDCDCPTCSCPFFKGVRPDQQLSLHAPAGIEHPPDCDCPLCDCPGLQKAVRPTDLKPMTVLPVKHEEVDKADHPADCNCPTCTCPGLKKTAPISTHPSDCNCPVCECPGLQRAVLPTDLKPTIVLPVGHEGVGKATHPSDCNCPICECPGSNLKQPKLPEKESKPKDVQDTKPEDCTCTVCGCGDSVKIPLHQARLLKEEGGLASCDCPSCRCAPCPDPNKGLPGVPPPPVESRKAIESCDCHECNCKPCADPSKVAKVELAKPRAVELLEIPKKIPHPPDCRCRECMCLEEIIQTELVITLDTGTQPADEPQVHALDCACPECLCVECTTKHSHLASCRCEQCVCTICDYKDKPAELPLPAPHRRDCSCIECRCDVCDLKEKISLAKSTPVARLAHHEGCNCAECLCKECDTESKPSLSCQCVHCLCKECLSKVQQYVRPLSRQSPRMKSAHPEWCKCLECLCRECDDIGRKPFEDECQCGKCICISCPKRQVGVKDHIPKKESARTELAIQQLPSQSRAETPRTYGAKGPGCTCEQCICVDCQGLLSDTGKPAPSFKPLEGVGPAKISGTASRPQDCDCLVCNCPEGEIVASRPVTPKISSKISHPKGCNCPVCKCAEEEQTTISRPVTPTISKRAAHPKDCDCLVCRCPEEPSSLARPVTPTISRGVAHPKDCDCLVCHCPEEPSWLARPVTPTISRRAAHPNDCDCLVCNCPEEAPAISKQGITVGRPVTPKISGKVSHPKDCDCPQCKHSPDCLCAKCLSAEEEITKSQQRTSSSFDTAHGPDCSCPECTCEAEKQIHGAAVPLRHKEQYLSAKSSEAAKPRLVLTDPPAFEEFPAPDCDCGRCDCSMCTRKPGARRLPSRGKAEPVLTLTDPPPFEEFAEPDCTCKTCDCAECTRKPGYIRLPPIPKTAETEKDIIQPARNQCDCQGCDCEICTAKAQLPERDSKQIAAKKSSRLPPKMSRPQTPVHCDCPTCTCDEGVLSKVEPESKTFSNISKQQSKDYFSTTSHPDETPTETFASTEKKHLDESAATLILPKPDINLYRRKHAAECDCPECGPCPDVIGRVTAQIPTLDSLRVPEIRKMDSMTLKQQIQAHARENCECRQEIEEIKKALNQIRCACTEAERRTARTMMGSKPFVKQASVFGQTMSGLKMALNNLQDKCKAKDRMIAAMAGELQLRGNEEVIDKVLIMSQQMRQALDYDQAEDVKSLDRSQLVADIIYPSFDIRDQATEPCNLRSVQSKSVEVRTHKRKKKLSKKVSCICSTPQIIQKDEKDCQKVDLAKFEVVDVRRITGDSLIIKWVAPGDKSITGYDIYINGTLASKVMSGARTSAMVHSLDLSKSVQITIYAVTKCGRCDPPAIAIYEIKP